MPAVDVAPQNSSSLNCAALKERLAALSATVADLQRQHYQRQFDDCWSRTGAADAFTAAPFARNRSATTNSSAGPSPSVAASSSVSAPPPAPRRRSAAIIRDLHLVGVCAAHDTDVSSCDEDFAREQLRTRREVARLRAEEGRQAAANETASKNVTLVGNAANAAGIAVSSGQMNHAAKVVATRSAAAVERFQHRRREEAAKSARRVAAIAARRLAKRLVEHGTHAALHTAPLFQKGGNKGKSSANKGGVASAFSSFSSFSAVDATTFVLSDYASVRAAELRGTPADTTSDPNAVGAGGTAVDRFRKRMRGLKALRRQEEFSTMMGPCERVAAELEKVTVRRGEKFHRQRGGGGGGGDDADE